MMNLNDLTRKFILSEGDSRESSVYTYLQSIKEIMDSMSPSSLRDRRRLQVMKEHLKEGKRHTRKLQERITILEEQVEILEESK